MKRALYALLLVALCLAAYPGWLAYSIWRQSHRDELHFVDAIVVLGAAQYNGAPSPVLKARLDHALFLYREGFSNRVIVTGGKRPGDRFTEAATAVGYLVDRDVPRDRILREDEGSTTLQSLSSVRDIAEDRGIDSVLLVSDPLHSERIKRIAHDLGFGEAYTSPASYTRLRRSRLSKLRQLLREVGSLVVYEVWGR